LFGRTVPLVQERNGGPTLKARGYLRLLRLAEVHDLTGQILLEEGMTACPHPSGSAISADGETSLPPQGGPGLLDGQSAGNVAETKPKVRVDAEDEQGLHGCLWF
jgi:hypothetical protein